jgi:hypothetical protein
MGASKHQQLRQLRQLPSQCLLLCLFWLELVCLCCYLAPTAAQQTMPFQGSGGEHEPPETPTPVYVSAVLDRLLQVDDQTYEFTASILFYLSWRDPRVKNQIAANTLKLQSKDSNYSCEVPCQSNNKIEAGGCCDGVWMPYIAFTNIKTLSQDRVVHWGLGFSAEGEAQHRFNLHDIV